MLAQHNAVRMQKRSTTSDYNIILFDYFCSSSIAFVRIALQTQMLT